MPEFAVWVFVILFFLLFIFWTNNLGLNERYKSLQKDYIKLNQSYTELTQDYFDLKQEYNEIKRDTKEVLTEYVATEILWEISGISKYRKLVDAIGILAKTN